MILVIHIISALGCLALMFGAIGSEILGHREFGARLPKYAAGSLVVMLVSGTGLIVVNNVHLLSACAEGLAYLAGTTVLYAAYRRLASRSISHT